MAPSDAALLSSSATDATTAAQIGTDPTTSTGEAPAATNDGGAPSSDAITGLTPEQVLQELKKSGYVDELRRQIIDAFNTASHASAPCAPASATTAAPQPASASSRLADNAQLPPNIPAQPTAASTTGSTISATNGLTSPAESPAVVVGSDASQGVLDVGSKKAFLAALAEPLKFQVEKEHDQLRFLDAREQQDKLVQLLETESVAHPERDALGDATLFDLLVRHIVATPTTPSPTAAMLNANGSLGRQANARIAKAIAELLNPPPDDADEADEDDDDDDVDDDDDDAIDFTDQIRAIPSKSTQPLPLTNALPAPSQQIPQDHA